jgi:septal ring factor EnvC (AmiA/AmiB activator)
VDVVLKKYDALEAEHKRLRVEHQLGSQARSLQLAEILQLKKELVEQRDRRLGLEREIKEIMSDKSRMISLEAEVEKLKSALRDALEDVTSLERKLQLSEHELAHSKRMLEKKLRPRTSSTAPPSPDCGLSVSAALLAPDIILDESPPEPKDPRSIWCSHPLP